MTSTTPTSPISQVSRPSEQSAKPGDDKVIALHEAAHAVVCVSQGLALTGASIGPPGNRQGRVIGPRYAPPIMLRKPNEAEVKRARGYAIYILAGLCAEQKAFGAAWAHGGECDIRQVHEIAGDFFEGTSQSTWPQEMMEQARSEVAKDWDAIRAIAELLLVRDIVEADVAAARS